MAMTEAFRRLGAAAKDEYPVYDACTGIDDHRRLAGGVGGPNIFELDYGYVDDVNFWIAFVGMVFFCVLVDRTQALLDHLAEGSPTNERFLQKVYTELLMFGVVAVTLFMMMQVTTEISPTTMTIITFIDVLCSMGACSLIGIAGVLSVLRRIYWKHWVSCEFADRKAASAGTIGHSTSTLQQVSRAMVGVAEKSWEHAFCVTTPTNYSAMSKLFKKAHLTPPEFNYHLYLGEVLTRACCELMSINWATWLILMASGCFAILVELLYTEPPSLETYLVGVLCINWSLLVAHFVILLVVRLAFRKMLQGLGGEDLNVHYLVGPKWGERTQWAVQIIQLFNSFCFAFYLMHTKYNLRCDEVYHHIVVFLPLAINILIMLPLTLPQLVLVDAFALDADALDLVLSQGQQADEDLRYMLARWLQRGCPEFDTGNAGGLNMAAFRNLMPVLGMHASLSRVKRVFMLLDADNSGTVDVNEFLDRLRALREVKGLPKDASMMKQPGATSTPGGASSSGPKAVAAVGAEVVVLEERNGGNPNIPETPTPEVAFTPPLQKESDAKAIKPPPFTEAIHTPPLEDVGPQKAEAGRPVPEALVVQSPRKIGSI